MTRFLRRQPSSMFVSLRPTQPFASKSSSFASSVEKPNAKPHDDSVLGSWQAIASSITERFSDLWERKSFTFPGSCSLQDLLGESMFLFPEHTRRFWRFSALKPEDFLEILEGFNLNCIDRRRAEFLWKLFCWASQQHPDFSHLPRSYDLMLSILLQERMFRELETIVFSAERKAILSFGIANEAGSEVVRRYAQQRNLNFLVAAYRRARDCSICLSALCYRDLLNLFVAKGEANLAMEVYSDMLKAGIGLSSKDRFVVDFVVKELTKRGAILDAVNVLRKARAFGVEACAASLTLIVERYCRKKDFDDMFKFMIEWGHVPRSRSCNWIISCLCRSLGVEEAWSLAQRMEGLGFVMDGTTFGVLISQGCRERKLRHAFVYLSECLRRKIRPSVHAYNVLIGGAFSKGLHIYAKDIFDEMLESGLNPVLETFKVMLAGYCKYRQLDKVKLVMDKMFVYGAISTDLVEDPLVKAFTFLCLDKLGVKLKRDNSPGQINAEFFDSLGNGLYLEARDLDEYERLLGEIIENSMLPNFDSTLLDKCRLGDVEGALNLKDEAHQWGHNLSLPAFTEMLKCLFDHPNHMEEFIFILEEMPELFDQIDQNILNLLIQSAIQSGKKKITRLILCEALKRNKEIHCETYTALFMGFCREEDIEGLQESLQLAGNGLWKPCLEDIKVFGCFLCKRGMITELMYLLNNVLLNCSEIISDSCNIIISQLCENGYVSVSCLLMEEILKSGFIFLGHEAYVSLFKAFLGDRKYAEALGIFDIFVRKNVTSSEEYLLAIPLLINFDRFEEVIQVKQYLEIVKPEDVDFVYGTLLGKLCRMRNFSEEISWLLEVIFSRALSNGSMVNTLIKWYCLEGFNNKINEILCFLLRMNVDLSLSNYGKMVSNWCVHGKVRLAWSLQKLMIKIRKKEAVILYNKLLYSLFRSGNKLLVEDLLLELREKHVGLDQTAYNFLVHGFQRSGNISRSIEIFLDMITQGFRPSNRSLRIVFSHLCKNDELEKALELCSLMLSSRWKYGSTVRNMLIGCLLSHQRFKYAEFLLDQMQEKNLVYNNSDYNYIIEKFSLYGRVGKAIELLNIMLKEEELPNEESYSSIIIGICKRGNFELSLDFYAEMRHRHLVPSTEALDVMVSGLTRYRYHPKALEERVLPSSTPMEYYVDVNNNLKRASEILYEMWMHGRVPKFETHWSLIRNLNSYGCNDNEECTGFLSQLLSGRNLR